MAVVFRHHAGKSTVRMRRQRLCCHALQRRGAGVLLPAAVPTAGARQAVLLDDHVPHLAGHAVGAMVNFSIVHNACAHAGAQRHGHKPFAAAACTHVEFRQCRAVGVVFDVQRDIQIFMEQLAQRHVPQRQVAGVRDGAGANIHRPRHANAHRGDFTQRHAGSSGQLLCQRCHRPRQPLPVDDRRHLHLLRCQQVSALVHQPGLQVGPADVHSYVFHG